MLFGNKQLDEKNRIICSLEAEREVLLQKLRDADDIKCQWERDINQLKNNIEELEKQLRTTSDDLISVHRELDVSRQDYIVEQQELKQTQDRVKEQEKQITALIAENSDVRDKLTQYRRMSAEKYLQLGTELFTLEQLKELLERAHSKAFTSSYKEQKKQFLQKFIEEMEVLLCPISTDYALLKLLSEVETENSATKLIQSNLERVTLGEIIEAKSVDMQHCVLIKRMQGGQENICIAEANNVEEYARKIVIGRLAKVIKEICDKGSEPMPL